MLKACRRALSIRLSGAHRVWRSGGQKDAQTSGDSKNNAVIKTVASDKIIAQHMGI
jgi:hypothetical protein